MIFQEYESLWTLAAVRVLYLPILTFRVCSVERIEFWA